MFVEIIKELRFFKSLVVDHVMSRIFLCWQTITLAGKVLMNTMLSGWININEASKAVLKPEDHTLHPIWHVGAP